MSQQGVLGVNSSSERDIEFITGNTGGAVGPDAFFNINLLGTGNISVAGTPGSNLLSISDSSGFSATTSTSDATPTEITRVTFNNNESYVLTFSLLGIQGSYNAQYSSRVVLAARKAALNDVQIVGVPIIQSMQDFSSVIAGFSAEVSSSVHLVLNVIGLAGTNINWEIQGNLVSL